ncbi:E3 ubiquitin-protein ligase TRAIP-like [Mizuhopecten yessoensis]|uniref:E3 ubiquitin-protein ligase TRAIP-like n=1 Tax=Mizuhopecten yessoensis TaxID=6573 RepID=UPI000B4580C8|nr:E3 ubiquitin-protein ligase TRAIP-like [Mizuhopecten yessoensis]
MKALCCICSDLFVNDASISISATPCGHTFHEECLFKWLATSSTCPSCRSRVNRSNIIHKLYFDGGEEGDEGTSDPSKLSNDIQDLKLKLSKFKKEKADLIEERNATEVKKQDIEDGKIEALRLLKQEETTNASLRKQLQYFKSQEDSLKIQREECRKIKKKFVDLQNVEKLVTGSEEEVQNLVQSSGESGSTRQMATYLVVMKREFQQVKEEKKKVKSEFDKCRRLLMTKDRELNQATSELSTLTECYSKSEDELKQKEKEVESLKQKLSRLKRAIVSPCVATPSASSSFVETLMEESPAPATPVQLKPSPGEIDLDGNIGSPDFVKPSPNTHNRFHCEENKMKFVKISSAASSQNPAKKAKRDLEDISNITGLGNFNIFKKKACAGDLNSVFRKGYDGLGGHTSFTQHLGRPGAAKPVSKTASRLISKNGKIKKIPPLPSMDQFVNLT